MSREDEMAANEAPRDMMTRTITADKAGIIAELETQQTYNLDCGENMQIPRYKRERYKGIARGLFLAIRVLKDWDLEDK